MLGVHGNALALHNVESVVMPGDVIEKHAKFEADCANCHVRFDRDAQPRLCLGCHDHRDVASDVRNRQGYHGRIKQRACRGCHTDHKGRGARIVVLDERSFDHRLTDFALRGKHADAKCADCHRANTKYSSAPADCATCHRKDEKHKGGLGPKCESCHDETNWKDTRFDHDRTRYPLRYRHVTVKCADCHIDERYKGTPADCASCHRKDDEHKGQLGTRCEKCHDESKWKSTRFDHDRDSRFMLRGKHRDAKCADCHKQPGFRDKPPSLCFACHERADQEQGHRGRYGEKCQSCHDERAWKPATFDHDRDTRYPLRDRHRAAKCDACHRDLLYREKPETRCLSCHQRDDKHRTQRGTDCARCHNERGWREIGFDHGQTRFPLLGNHARVDCGKCHLDPAYKEAKAECVSCHAKDDKHKGRFPPACKECHGEQGWKKTDYDHGRRTRFKLDGRHVEIACYACHKRPLTDKPALAPECMSCHKADDVHFGTYGPLCQRCHVAADWRKVIADWRKMIKRDGKDPLASPISPGEPR